MIALRVLANGTVVREAVFPDAPILVGREAGSDFVIVDPSVSRRHARIGRDEGGAVWIEDLGSRNGIKAGGKPVMRLEVPRGGSVRWRAGAVELELAHDSTGETQELARVDVAPRPGSSVPTLAYWLAGVTAWIAVFAIDPGFWSPWKTDRSTSALWTAVGTSALLPVAAFVVLGLLRIAGRRVRFAETLRAISLLSWMWPLVGAASLAGAYALSPRASSMLSASLASLAGVVSVAHLAGLARTRGRGRFLLGWAGALTVLLAAASVAGHLAARQMGRPDTDYKVMVPILGVTGPASTVEDYFGEIRSDFEKAEAQAGEELRASKSRPRR